MFQILDSSELREAMRFACKLTGKKRILPQDDFLSGERGDEYGQDDALMKSRELKSCHRDQNRGLKVQPRRVEPKKYLRRTSEKLFTVAASVCHRKKIPAREKNPIIDVTEVLSDQTRQQVEQFSSQKMMDEQLEKKMEIRLDSFEYREKKLQKIVKNMCQRSNFSGAIVTDSSALPVVVLNSPVSVEAVPAFMSVLSSALEGAGEMLGHHGAEYLSMDIDFEEKVVLRRFVVDKHVFFLLVVSPQGIDERSEIEVSIEQIKEVLSEKG